MTSGQNTTVDQREEPNVSVVIPTYNRASLLPRALRSVLAQTYQDIEIIIVDDASTDDTKKHVESFSDPRIHYIRHDCNRGAAVARNTGIKVARGRLIAFQDSDDEWLLDKLERQIGHREHLNDEATIVYCGFVRLDCGSALYIPESHIKTKCGNILEELLRGNFISTQTLLIPRTCFDRVGYFDDRLERFQDWELALRLATCFEFAYVDEPLVITHHTLGNISSNDSAAPRALETILDKHRHELARHPAALAKFQARLGHSKCRIGHLSEGRAHLLYAVKLRPLFWSGWVGLLLTFFGRSVYLRSMLGIRRTVRTLRCFRNTMPGDLEPT